MLKSSNLLSQISHGRPGDLRLLCAGAFWVVRASLCLLEYQHMDEEGKIHESNSNSW